MPQSLGNPEFSGCAGICELQKYNHRTPKKISLRAVIKFF
ncbi:unnamed protein product, partial [marine sediment metagenome]